MAKFTITLKDPYYSFNTEANHEAKLRGITAAESRFLDTFLEWGEYLTVEFDTTKGTARVVPIRELKE
jgi:hypothetical protein